MPPNCVQSSISFSEYRSQSLRSFGRPIPCCLRWLPEADLELQVSLRLLDGLPGAVAGIMFAIDTVVGDSAEDFFGVLAPRQDALRVIFAVFLVRETRQSQDPRAIRCGGIAADLLDHRVFQVC